jgi:hypothetical protein
MDYNKGYLGEPWIIITDKRGKNKMQRKKKKKTNIVARCSQVCENENRNKQRFKANRIQVAFYLYKVIYNTFITILLSISKSVFKHLKRFANSCQNKTTTLRSMNAVFVYTRWHQNRHYSFRLVRIHSTLSAFISC